MSRVDSIAGVAPWLFAAPLQRLLKILGDGGEEARVAGGAVRNALLGEPVRDIDIATTNRPEETTRRAEAVGFKVRPTGIDHGTVSVIMEGRPYEVTTLRADVRTDGRHAKVVYGRDWRADARRRDFTINALYADPDGTIVDLIGGRADIETRTIRFIDDAESRIREDYLRILRFFRFFAWYGAGRPDAEGLKACARLKNGVTSLSAERVWSELYKLLSAPDPSRALLWMRQTGILGIVLPEGEKWGIDAIHELVASERDLGWPPDPILRLEAIVPPDPARMEALAARLRLSNAQRARLVAWARARPPAVSQDEAALARRLYREDRGAFEDRLRLLLARARSGSQDPSTRETAADYARQLALVEDWERPVFPLRGRDLIALGAPRGPALGALLIELENDWIGSDFSLEKSTLKARAAERMKSRFRQP